MLYGLQANKELFGLDIEAYSIDQCFQNIKDIKIIKVQTPFRSLSISILSKLAPLKKIEAI